MRAVHTKTGFTLIELMVTVAILAIVLAVGVPSFQRFIRDNQVRTDTNAFISGLQLARSEAVKRGTQVSVNAAGASFAAGFCVHTGGTGTNCDNATRIRSFQALESSVATTTTRIVFSNLGELSNSTGAVSVALSPPDCATGEDGRERTVTIGLGGQVRVQRGDCS